MRRRRRPRPLVRLTIYSKPGCHLCEDMKSLVHRVVVRESEADQICVDEIDISADRELLDRYGLEIPVLLIDGQKVAKYRVSEQELRRMLEGRKG
jgi:glutaredoxin